MADARKQKPTRKTLLKNVEMLGIDNCTVVHTHTVRGKTENSVNITLVDETAISALWV